jgi:hypothetical protein
MLAGTECDVMPRRVPVEKHVDGLRATVTKWLEWCVRRERITWDPETSPRLIDLEKLLDSVARGDEVEIHADNLPPQLVTNSRSWYLLTGDRLIQK